MTATNQRPDATGGAGPRRLRYGASTAILLIAATASCIIAIILASAHRLRLDATSTREHTLSGRTMQALRSLESPHEIVVVAEASGLDPVARERIDDVLSEIDRASDQVTYSRVDPVAPADRLAYASLLERLADLQREPLDTQAAGTSACASSAEALAEAMPGLSDRLLAVRDALSGDPSTDAPRRQLTDAAAAARTWSADLHTIARSAREEMQRRVAGSSIPALDRAQQALFAPLRRLALELDALRKFLDRLGGAPAAGDSPAAASAIREAAARAAGLRDSAAAAADSLERLPPMTILGIARALEEGPAAVIVSPTGATAVNFEALFPTREQVATGQAGRNDVRVTGEELIATALAALNDPRNPIVVFIHSGSQRMLDDSGGPAGDEARMLLGQLLSRLRLRGIAAAEWPVALEEAPPAMTRLDPGGRRPVVWVAIGVSGATAEGAPRVETMAASLRRLIDDGASVLLTLETSTLPGAGEPDPVAEIAAPFGMKIDSGRAILRRMSTPSGWTVAPGLLVAGDRSEHPIGAALRGLNTLLPWPMAIEITAGAGVSATTAPDQPDAAASGGSGESGESGGSGGAVAWPLLVIPADDNIWGEAQWLEFRMLSSAQRAMVANPPAPDPKWDNVRGPWVVAAAAERTAPDGRPQRLVAVASNGWFFDEFTQEAEVVEGRRAPRFPGNDELFEAAVRWLAFRDEMIAPSPQARSVPRIGPLTAGQLSALRWALIAGLPALVVAAGGACRVLRG